MLDYLVEKVAWLDYEIGAEEQLEVNCDCISIERNCCQLFGIYPAVGYLNYSVDFMIVCLS